MMPRTKRQKIDRKKSPYNPQSSALAKLPGSGNKQQHRQAQHSQPTIPFDVHDNILLVGEGDLSFAASLITDHGCACITATTFDSAAEVLLKYPHATKHINTIKQEEQKLIHSIDATKLSTYKSLRTQGPYVRIIFNFPHVGGKSTDINRQVRFNQSLLVSFFKCAISLLNEEDGSILVTLFEGQPYELWNIRDLGRSVGLVVKRSFRFMADAYPGYRHVRTLGVIKSGSGEVSESAWKGEGRAARTFEFGLKGSLDVPVVGGSGGKGKNRKRGKEESSGDEDD